MKAMRVTIEVDEATIAEVQARARERGLPLQEALVRVFAAGMAILRLTAPATPEPDTE